MRLTTHPQRYTLLSGIALLIATFALVGAAGAATHTVCASGCDYGSIQTAVDAAAAGDTLELEPETFTESDIFIDTQLTLKTSSGRATIDAAGGDYVFKVWLAYVTLEDLTVLGAEKAMILNHGDMVLSTVFVQGDTFDTLFGGIFNGVEASMTLTHSSVVSSNASANYGGGITNYGDLVINNSTVTANRGRFGGGVLNRGDTSVSNSSFSFNHATGWGGAWYNDTSSSMVYHTSSSYSGNTAVNCAKYRNVPLGQCVN